MPKKLLTLDDLVKFCVDNKMYRFNSEESGYKICVQIPSVYEKAESDETGSILYADLKLLHTNRNRNGSNVTKDAAEKCMSSLKYKPILANFCEIDGEKDFTSHDFDITDDGIVYLEHQVGCVTSDEPWLEYDEEKGRHYLYAKAAIPREYTAAAEIIERKNGTKLSVELAVNAMKYDVEEKELILTDIEIIGVTLLGKNAYTGEEIQEGMEGARLDLSDFSVRNNTIKYNNDNKIIELLEQLNLKLSNFNINAERSAKKSEEGGENQMKFNELLEKYCKKVEDITFEYENLSDEELENTFAEAFADECDGASNDVEDGDDTELDVDDIDSNDANSIKYSVSVGGNTKTFSISVADKVYALQELVNATYSESDDTYYSVELFDDDKIVVMKSLWSWNNLYRQSYTESDGIFTLVGDREKVFVQYLTKSEIDELDNMRKNYSSISEKLAKYESEPLKIEILGSKDYEAVVDTEEFVELSKNDVHFDMSVDDVRKKADDILLTYAKAGKLNFVKSDENKPTGKKFISTKPKASRYGNIFSK